MAIRVQHKYDFLSTKLDDAKEQALYDDVRRHWRLRKLRVHAEVAYHVIEPVYKLNRDDIEREIPALVRNGFLKKHVSTICDIMKDGGFSGLPVDTESRRITLVGVAFDWAIHAATEEFARRIEKGLKLWDKL